MTDNHNELASAYFDGQVSPEEAARVERDPQLMAEVDALAAVVERLQTEEAAVDRGTRQRHLSAALAAFDQAVPTNVIPLNASARRHPDGMARGASAPADYRQARAQRPHPRRRQGLPGWLSAAAVLLVVGGGIGWFMSRQDRSDETAAVSMASDEAAGDAASDAALSQATDGGGGPLTTVAEGDAAKASVENAADGSAEAQQATPALDATTADTTAAAPSTTTSRAVASPVPSSTGPVPPGGLSFATAPTGAEVEARLDSTGQSLQPAGLSVCGGTVTAPAGTALSGYVPLTVGGVAGEGLFYRAGSGSGFTTVLVVRTSSCQAFS
ncbi:MAG: hypothetical protein OEY70_11830 [Acidimicrobiia bacterium]|nr:hypothetical protein [Acidimicrobiia bacterium]